MLLRGVSYEVVSSDSTQPVAGAVAAANVPPVLAIFNVDAYGPDSAVVIDVSRVFTAPPPEFSPAQRVGAGYTVDATRSWIERTSSFPDNVNVYSRMRVQNTNAGRGGGAAAPAGRGGAAVTAPSATITMSYSFHKLPEKPMMPRLFDERVGYFTTTRHGLRAATSTRRRARATSRAGAWRRRIPNAAISEPVKPIVYYIDAATPTKWVPWLKQGDRRLAAGVRGGGLQERDHRARRRRRERIRTGARKTCATR